MHVGRSPRPLVDCDGRVFGALAGCPRDPQWGDVAKEAGDFILRSKELCVFSPKQATHRRGNYPSLAEGISYGGGQKRVDNLKNSTNNTRVLNTLNQNVAICRLTKFGNAALQLFAPGLYNFYEENIAKLKEDNQSLCSNFNGSVFGGATYNFGPNVVTAMHTNHANLAWGWCSVTALRNFDHKQGGHLILWDLRLVIEFPAGATILIPSAILLHSNVNINANETRCSFTQYSAGGLFRWVDCRFQTQKQFEAEGGDMKRLGPERWKHGLSMLSWWKDFKL
ncbi:uncharacterized protein LAESUDRAFT_660356 [Laetiporus sulphureus 93-53]|uniref:2OGFeDO JBP1/TET oxygenase domain-containing protein n=1 Tax=Laetiporus sulphureus 93-53 TaxID=1314785 RepID=A0A165CQJ5_9APHY|nr:uncharacterized protein LAESUDRAFT_660356 [Laetiporus sulphureus 93-53]KZT03240.1 hypothetical protein LAESUDRAFT_660356 [Laetiporus sulphureus 93-53]